MILRPGKLTYLLATTLAFIAQSAVAQVISGNSSVAIDPETLAAIAQNPGQVVPSSSLPQPASVPIESARISQPGTLPPEEAGAQVTPEGAPYFDYRVNLASDVFGANLFTGAFARQTAAQFNPDYIINIGDRIRIRLWGAYEYSQILTVDPRGNVFVPNVGPVQVAGARNQQLQNLFRGAIGTAFRSNVYSYASLAEAQPVRVFVSGFVNRPGLYSGTSMDSLLHYIDLAGGIDLDRGSFLDIEVKRGEMVRSQVDLYRFLLEGVIPTVQLADGDVIFVGPRQNTVTVGGLAENARIFEFPADEETTTADVIAMAKPLATATHMRIVRNTGPVRNVEYYPLSEASKLVVQNGDELDFTADKKPGSITVRVEGEHDSPQEYVLPYGARLGDLLGRIEYSERSDPASIQLYRKSVKERQKELLAISLKNLEAAALTASSGTSDEARLRAQEADLILKWIDRAKDVDPKGQVIIADARARDGLLLENGDILHVPVKDGLVLVSGEVLFPVGAAYAPDNSVEDYIVNAGGYTQKNQSRRIIIAHRNGSFDEVKENSKSVRAGDEILVMPKVDVKSRQIFKELTQILYQIAVSAGVVLRLR